jgi:hypothetical protein
VAVIDAGIIAYSAEPGSPSHDALNLLASWAATLDQEQVIPVDRTSITLPEQPQA